jgi:Rrf2 family nitric oxide-sensitive transcriptional repressor
MRLSRFTDYSLLVLTHLGQTDEKRVTIDQISKTYDISKNHLMKVVSNLSRLQFVVARRGPGGGLMLNHDPADINLGEVIRHTEKNLQQHGVNGANRDAAVYPRLSRFLQQAMKNYLDTLRTYTLADVIQGDAQGALVPELRKSA